MKEELTLKDYQKKAMLTCLPESRNFSYMMLNLVGEIGEFASKVAKQIRKGNAGIGLYGEDSELVFICDMDYDLACEIDDQMKKEAGDILWQLSGLCTVMGWQLDEVAMENLEKLASRQKRDVIDGDGDNR